MDRLTWEYKDGGMFVDETDIKTFECDDVLMHTGNAIIRLAKYEDVKDKVEDRINEIKNSSDYPHNFKGQMVEDLEWVLSLLN